MHSSFSFAKYERYSVAESRARAIFEKVKSFYVNFLLIFIVNFFTKFIFYSQFVYSAYFSLSPLCILYIVHLVHFRARASFLFVHLANPCPMEGGAAQGWVRGVGDPARGGTRASCKPVSWACQISAELQIRLQNVDPAARKATYT